jgi:hypothetical protein
VLGHRLCSGTRLVLTDGPGQLCPPPECLELWGPCPGQTGGDGGRLALVVL